MALLTAALIVNFVREIYKPIYRITPFRVARDLAASGYTGETLRDAYVFALSRVVAESNSELRRIARSNT